MPTTVSASTLQGLIDSGSITPQQVADKVRSGEIAVLDDVTVAGLARHRLGQQGLTLDQVKADPENAIRPAATPTAMQEFASDPFRGTGAALKGAALAIPQAVATASSPTDPMTGVNIGLDMARRHVKADQDYENDPVRRGVSKTLASVPIVGGMVQDLAQPSMIAPNREPTPEEREAAGGAAVNVGMMLAGGPALKGSTGRGAGIVSRAEGQYARAVATPLTESLASKMAPEMMDRVGVVNNPAKIAANAGARAAESTLDAAATSAVTDALPKTQKGVAGTRASLMDQQSALANDAQFQSNVQQITDALANTNQRGVGNVLYETAKNTVKGAALGAAAPFVPAAGPVGAVVKTAAIAKGILYDLPKTTAFQTASAIAKRKFGQALQSGDLASAADIGRTIALGEASPDDYGHRSAVQTLSKELEPFTNTDQRRQVVASKQAVYVDPKRGEVPIPRNVMVAFTNSPRLTETESPIIAWVSAMAKQGNLTKGGSIEFR